MLPYLEVAVWFAIVLYISPEVVYFEVHVEVNLGMHLQVHGALICTATGCNYVECFTGSCAFGRWGAWVLHELQESWLIHICDLTRFIHICDVTHSHMRHDSSLWGASVVQEISRDMTHSYVWHDSLGVWHDLFTYLTWLIHMCDMTHSHMYDKTQSYVWHDSFTYVTWLIHIRDVTHSQMWHDSCHTLEWV